MENLKQLRARKEKIRLELWDLCHNKNSEGQSSVKQLNNTRRIHELSKEQTLLIEKIIKLEID